MTSKSTIVRQVCSFLKKNILLVATLGGVVLGVGLGFALRSADLDEQYKRLVGFPGTILLSLFKMIVLPLITITLICGVGKMDRKQLGIIGSLSLLLFLVTTLIAVSIGLLAVFLVNPGNPSTTMGAFKGDFKADKISTIDTLLDLLRGAFPENLFEATLFSPKTKYTNKTNAANVTKTEVKIERANGSNIMGLVLFAMVFGGTLSYLGEDAKPLMDVMNVADRAIGLITMLVIWYTPFGLIYLIADKIIDIHDFATTAKMLGLYLMVSLLCQLLVFIMQNVIYTVLAWRNPFELLFSQAKALALAAGTSSSMATLPVNMECIEKNMGVVKAISQVVLPVGATVNMNGTAVHIAISSIFIAQLNGAHLSFTEYLVVWITSTIAAVGAAGVPSSSIFTMVAVLTAIGQDVRDISLILPLEWILDRCRTVNNTYGDAMVACILNRYLGKKMSQQKDKTKTKVEIKSPLAQFAESRYTASSVESKYDIDDTAKQMENEV
ncbi:unnamed protein product, partial [Mesorhabditis belari]|uniref:Amino acid transporter n=1 Tax=Mesorhabditis belari TaxID=2138241 RepID=A0AAF3J979_9BILA